MHLTFFSQLPKKHLNKEVLGCRRERALESETWGLPPRAYMTYHVSEPGFPLLYKGATNTHFPALYVIVPESENNSYWVLF